MDDTSNTTKRNVCSLSIALSNTEITKKLYFCCCLLSSGFSRYLSVLTWRSTIFWCILRASMFICHSKCVLLFFLLLFISFAQVLRTPQTVLWNSTACSPNICFGHVHTLIHSQTDLCHWISESLSSQTTIEFQFQQRICSWVDERVCGKQSNWNPCVHGSIQLQCAIWNSAYTQTDTLLILCRQQARTTMRILQCDGLRDISLRNGWIFEPCTNHCST